MAHTSSTMDVLGCVGKLFERNFELWEPLGVFRSLRAALSVDLEQLQLAAVGMWELQPYMLAVFTLLFCVRRVN